MIIKNSTQNSIRWKVDDNPSELSTDIYPEAIIEDSIINVVNRNLFRISERSPHEFASINDNLETVEVDLGIVKKFYGFKNTSHYSKKTQRWVGYVLKIEEGKFFSRLDDLTNPGTHEIGEFEISEVSPEDVKLLERGAIFYWSIGDTMSNGQLKKESIIRFKRSSEISTSDIDSIEDRAEEIMKKNLLGLVTRPNFSIPPDSNQFEISLIGTGGGYGESVVVHLGNGEWIVVDSCQSPENEQNLPLEYLQAIGVNTETQVKLIICTHWHDDHILGISKILNACGNAELSFARVSDIKKFLILVGLDYNKVGNVGSISSTKEFGECIKILESRGKNIKAAGPDRLLYKTSINFSQVSEVFSLSPSDQAIKNFDLEISQLITDYGESRKKIIIDSPNDKSVVLYLRLGNHKALLGADLEVTNSSNTGWFDIINNSATLRNEKATYFKVPHHGSENGYHERIWIELLESDPNASLSPWSKGTGLPTPEMIKKLREHTTKLYITSSKIGYSKGKKRDREIEKIIEKFRFKLSEVKYSKGIIRNRIRIGDIEWETETFDAATKV